MHAIQDIRCAFLDWIMVFITKLGDGGAIWIAIGFAMLFFKKYRRCGVAIFVSLLFCLIFGNILIKNIVGRSRPCEVDTTIKLLIDVPWGHSFPSGHSFSSVATALCILRFHKIEGIIAFVLAILVAFSRLYLFVHYPTDILAGILFGCVAALVGILVTNRYYEKIPYFNKFKAD